MLIDEIEEVLGGYVPYTFTTDLRFMLGFSFVVAALLRTDDTPVAGIRRQPHEASHSTGGRGTMNARRIDEIVATVRPILEDHGVRRAGLFGSVVQGGVDEDSDVDILVEPPAEASLLDLGALKTDLEEALGCEVDLVEYGTIHPRLKERILDQQVAVV